MLVIVRNISCFLKITILLFVLSMGVVSAFASDEQNIIEF